MSLSHLAKWGRKSKLFELWQWWQLTQKGRQSIHLFDTVERYCLFVGHGRSGHSLIAALLNAHSQIVMADEVNSLHWLEKGLSREQLYGYILTHAEAYAAKGSRKGKALGKLYSYEVAGQWQGKFKEIRVIGEASLATAHLHNNPALLERLRAVVGVPVIFLQVVRNPYDGISRISQLSQMPLDKAVRHYFWVCERVQQFRATVSAQDIWLVRHEALLANGKEYLGELGQFLGLEMDEAYLEACAGILFRKPQTARHELAWSPEQIANVAGQIEKYSFLTGYRYDN